MDIFCLKINGLHHNSQCLTGRFTGNGRGLHVGLHSCGGDLHSLHSSCLASSTAYPSTSRKKELSDFGFVSSVSVLISDTGQVTCSLAPPSPTVAMLTEAANHALDVEH